MGDWAAEVVDRSRAALAAVADPEKAPAMEAYMRHVAPFFGVQAGPRRAALRAVWKDLESPATSDDLGAAARALMAERERELHYAAYDLIERYLSQADEHFCERHVEALLCTVPWWDTVDGLVSHAVSPLCRRFGLADLVDRWSESGDRWLIRAALGHQRGWKEATDLERVAGLCSRHWEDPELFVAKAIGWALRDAARLDPDRVGRFLDEHPTPNPIAVRRSDRATLGATGAL